MPVKTLALALRSVVLSLTVVSLVACGGGTADGGSGGGGNSGSSNGGSGGGSASGSASVVLQSIVLTPANATVQVGKTLRLVATGNYSNGTTGSVSNLTWSSSTKSVATVDVSGVVSALAEGSSTITVTSDNVVGSTTIGITAGAAAVSYLYSFGLPPDGTQPNGPLLQGSDGNFYGTTGAGGGNTCLGEADFCGVVFKLTPAGVETILYAFGASASDGFFPNAPLIQASDGNFYGTTESGGTYGFGTVFKMTPNGVLTVLYSFGASPSDGITPSALIQGSDGNFYGTTPSGGANDCSTIPGMGNNCGTVFEVTATGVETVLHSFGASASDGVAPTGQLLQASDGNFYGATAGGGAYGAGTVFKITPAGVESVLHAFGAGRVNGSSPEGAGPIGPLIQASDGNLYGATPLGGRPDCDDGCGTVFRISLNGALSTLYSFAGSSASDGYGPSAVIQGSDGNFYGTTANGGAFGPDLNGTVFQITPTGTETVLYSFGPLSTNPSEPNRGVIQASDGAFYGVTKESGDTNPGAGTVFKLVTTR